MMRETAPFFYVNQVPLWLPLSSPLGVGRVLVLIQAAALRAAETSTRPLNWKNCLKYEIGAQTGGASPLIRLRSARGDRRAVSRFEPYFYAVTFQFEVRRRLIVSLLTAPIYSPSSQQPKSSNNNSFFSSTPTLVTTSSSKMSDMKYCGKPLL